MRTTVEFLDAVKDRNSLTSDYALSNLLGITRSAVSALRNKKDFMGDSTAIRVAELLDLHPGYVMACCHAERAKKAEEKAAWASVIETLGGLAASIALGVSLFVPSPPAGAVVAYSAPDQFVLCKTRRRGKRSTFEAVLSVLGLQP